LEDLNKQIPGYLFLISTSKMNSDDLQASFFTQKSSKPTNSIEKCTRCGTKKLIDITHHEFPKQQGLLFECMSCGNNSLRSNVSDDERQRRLAMIAAEHLNITTCQFCSKHFHSHNDYLLHVQTDHTAK
jgi:hypothetical protein